MAGQIWARIFFILLLHIETVLGDYQNSSETALSKRTLPCYFKENKVRTSPHNGTDLSTTYELFISTPWIKHKGCYYRNSNIDDKKQAQLEYNSPGRCSLFCTSGYFGVKIRLCVCLKREDLTSKMSPSLLNDCSSRCPDNTSKASCGSSGEKKHFNVYQHIKEFNKDLVDHHGVDINCMVAKAIDKTILRYKAVSCSKRHIGLCFFNDGGTHTFDHIPKTKDDAASIPACKLFGDQNDILIDKLPIKKYFWTSFNRSNLLIWKKKDRKYKISNSECHLETFSNWTTVELSLHSAGKTHSLITLRCSLGISSECTVDKDIEKKEEHRHDYNIFLSTSSEYISSLLETSTKGKSTYTTITTEFESLDLSTNVGTNTTYDWNTTETYFHSENYVFALQIGTAISVSCLVILIATVACCMNRPKRGTYTFPISRSEENIVMATEGPQQDIIPTAALAENYSEPKDKAFTSNEMDGPRFCATTPCHNTNCQKPENGEYNHLDFTLRSATAPRFADNNEYAHVRTNVISVFEQPWDTATSKVNKLFSQISKSVVQKGQNVRKSLIKRRVSRSGSPKLKCPASDYCDAWKTQLNKQQFVFDSDVDNQSDISIDIANSTVDSNTDKPKLRRTDSAFPVLPYSERINVKSTHIYDEPDDRRMSLRERLLHMISIRPLKMPFGIELDLRASRSKSKIYSLATSIEEIDESVA